MSLESFASSLSQSLVAANDVLNQGTSLYNQVMGKTEGLPQTTTPAQAQAAEIKQEKSTPASTGKNPTLMYVGIGVAVLAGLYIITR